MQRTVLLAMFCASGLAASQAIADNFDAESFARWVTARAGTGEPVYWYSEGTVAEFPTGNTLVRMEGFDTARLVWPDRSVNKAYQLSRKIYVFRDLKTGEIIDTFNGRPAPQVRFPYQFITYELDGDQLVTTLEQGAGPSFLRIGPSSGITVRRLGNTFAYSAPLYLDVDGPPGIRRTVFENYDFFIQPDAADPREQFQLSWLRYSKYGELSDLPSIWHMVSWRVDEFEDLPQSMQDLVNDDAGLWRAPPENMQEIRRLQQPVD
ncbi:MAG: hypothetical protein V2J12_12555 [Gammaproteobacteria bacterium]|jgi:hypothetical protein|nr:hypothetical protein [Gammaproteobacteria bacterium]